MATDKNIVFKDLSLDNPEIELEGRSAILNSIKIFLSSFIGEYPHNINYGGYLVPWLFKPMTEITRIDIINTISTGIKKYFDNQVELHSVEVVGDISEMKWNIIITGTIKYMNESFEIKETMNRQVH